MKILHVISTLDPGGAENALLDLARGLRERMVEQKVAYLIGPGSLAVKFRELGIGVTKVPFESLLQIFDAVRALRVHMQSHNLTHSHLLKANSLCSLAAPKNHPLVGSRHNDERILENPVVAAIHRKLSRRENVHIAISAPVRDYYVAKRLEAGKFAVIPYGFEPAPAPALRDLRTEFALGKGPLLLHAGRLVPQKGQATLLEALTKVPEASLLLCGEGPLRLELEEKSRQTGLGGRVKFLGKRDDLASLMVSCDLFVLPSLWEGLGRVLLECMGAGLPVVASKASAIPEVLGETAWLAIPGNSASLADTITQALRERSSWPRRRGDMLLRLRERFSFSANIDAHLRIYQELLR